MSNVTHPKHYNSGKIEVIEAIEDWKLNFSRGNAVKYIARAGKKLPEKCNESLALEKEIEDLEKAAWYVKREIELLKAKLEGRATTRPNDMNPNFRCHATGCDAITGGSLLCAIHRAKVEGKCPAVTDGVHVFAPLPSRAGNRCVACGEERLT